MNPAQPLRPGPVALAISASIILAWFASAIALDQSLLATQRSNQLLGVGAVNGALLRTEGWWRLVISQFLHVHFPHMIFNALGVLVVGTIVERCCGRVGLVATYLFGGSAGQLAGVMAYPDLVSSGASQALMALCGAALLMCRSRFGYIAVATVLAVQLTLDIASIQKIKAGHGWGLVAGVLLGTVILVARKRSGWHPRHVA